MKHFSFVISLCRFAPSPTVSSHRNAAEEASAEMDAFAIPGGGVGWRVVGWDGDRGGGLRKGGCKEALKKNLQTEKTSALASGSSSLSRPSWNRRSDEMRTHTYIYVLFLMVIFYLYDGSIFVCFQIFICLFIPLGLRYLVVCVPFPVIFLREAEIS